MSVSDLGRYRDLRSGTESWMSKQQLAAHLGFSSRWVEMRVRDGMPHKRMGGRLRFRPSVVEAWLSAREEGAA